MPEFRRVPLGKEHCLRIAAFTAHDEAMNSEDHITYLARTNARNDRRVFGIRRRDRRHHMYIIGKTGTGKSTLLGMMAQQDIARGDGIALVDPHGDLVENILSRVPLERMADVVYLNVPAEDQPLSFNPLQDVPLAKRSFVATTLLDVFEKIWIDSWGPRLEHILRNALLTLMDQPNATLADILPLLDNRSYRTQAIETITNSQVKRFWEEEYEKYSWQFRASAIAPIQNKVGAFLTHPALNRILTQSENSFDLRYLMDERKILLVNLAKGRIGEESAALLGAMLVAQIGAAGLSRADVSERDRPDFYVYLDEFQTFTTQSLAGMLAELRKYRVNLTLANQYLSQVENEIADAILGNVGTLVSFRLGPRDATFLAREFDPTFEPIDLMNLPNHSIYLKLMIDGAVSKAFSAETLECSPSV